MWNRPPEFSGWKIVTFRKHAPRKRNGEEKTDHCNSPDLNSSVFQIILGRQNPLVLGGGRLRWECLLAGTLFTRAHART